MLIVFLQRCILMIYNTFQVRFCIAVLIIYMCSIYLIQILESPPCYVFENIQYLINCSLMLLNLNNTREFKFKYNPVLKDFHAYLLKQNAVCVRILQWFEIFLETSLASYIRALKWCNSTQGVLCHIVREC